MAKNDNGEKNGILNFMVNFLPTRTKTKMKNLMLPTISNTRKEYFGIDIFTALAALNLIITSFGTDTLEAYQRTRKNIKKNK